VQAIIFDWAGTTLDYGCFAPVIVFQEILKKYGIEPTLKEIRKPMGRAKREHIEKMLKMRRIRRLWRQIYGKKPGESDIDKLYSEFEKNLLKILPDHCKLIPGVLKAVAQLRKKNIKIGSTTGYTKEMIDVISPIAKNYGYYPDYIVTSSDVSQGRPMPFMCYLNTVNLKVFPFESVIKVGDTVEDIKEGLNSGMWSVGVIKGSSILGLSEKELKMMKEKELKKRIKKARKKFKKAGAHYVIESLNELDSVIDDVESKLKKGKTPSI